MSLQDAGTVVRQLTAAGFKCQEFTTSGTFNPSQALLAKGGMINLILVAAGGGSANAVGGFPTAGGGAGEVVFREGLTVASPTSVVIGTSGVNADGGDSTFGSALTAKGGKKGASGAAYNQSGGLGGTLTSGTPAAQLTGGKYFRIKGGTGGNSGTAASASGSNGVGAGQASGQPTYAGGQGGNGGSNTGASAGGGGGGGSGLAEGGVGGAGNGAPVALPAGPYGAGAGGVGETGGATGIAGGGGYCVVWWSE
jgi:hypothetical protein